MAILDKKKVVKKSDAVQVSAPAVFKNVVVSARVTEKASIMTDSHTYVFNVDVDATKKSIESSIVSAFKVSPVAVRLVAVPSKRKHSQGKIGKTNKGKKAYVTLKKGDTINFA